MCRNIRTLYNFAPPANEEVFSRAVDAVAEVTERLLAELVTNAAPKDREVEAAKARKRAQARYTIAAPS